MKYLALLLTLCVIPLALALPELPRVYVDTTMPTQTGNTITVNAGGNLQQAINSAQPGDTIVLQAGATFTGNFVLPTKSNPNNKWIVIKTSQENSLPPQGQRVTPLYAQYMPKIVTSNVGPVLDAAQGANYYRFIGIEITDDGHSSPYGPALPGGGTGNMNYGLIALGQIGRDTQLSQLPHHIIFDRSYIHGQPTTSVKFGITFDGAHMAAIDSYIADIHSDSQDSQAIRGLNGPGPFKIVNNHLEGSGENVMFGGADPSISGLIPSDVEIRNNYFYKPLTWKETHASYAGINWVNKNLFETKNIQRMLFEGNILENSWVDGQTGFGFVMKSSNQDGKCPWCVSQDHTIRNNILRNTDNGASIHGLDDYSNGGGIGQRRMLFEQNLFENVGVRSIQITRGSATQEDIVIRHNTIWSNEPSGYPFGVNFDAGTGTVAVNNLLIENNVHIPGTSPNARAIAGSGVATGVPSLNRFTTNWVVHGNVFVAPPDLPANIIANNIYTTRANGGFVDAANNNFALTSISSLKGTAVGGGDPGADIAAVQYATRGAISGVWGACTDTTWNPSPATKCGTFFQSSNCANTRQATGTLTCSGSTPVCGASNTCVQCTQDSHCGANSFCSNYVCAAVGLVASYNFSEGSGSTTADYSGNARTATLTGTTWGTGKSGTGLVFDGVTSKAEVNDFPPPQSITMSAWFYPTTTTGDDRLVLGKGLSEYEMRINSQQIFQAGFSGAVLRDYTVNFANPANLNTWYHYAYTYDKTTGQTKLYRNGNLINSSTGTGLPIDSINKLTIGRHPAGWGAFIGTIDNVRIWNAALTQAEIQADMNGAGGTGPSTKTGDLDGNGRVDIVDVLRISQDLGRTTCGLATDLNNDCQVNIFDFILAARNWG